VAEKDPNATEKATDKKRNKSRQDGSVPKSQEVGKVWALVGGFLALLLLIGLIGKNLKLVFSWFMTYASTLELNEKTIQDLLLMLSSKLAIMLIPYMLIVFTVVLVVQRLQVGPLWTAKVFEPKLSQFVNIVGGMKKLLFDVKTIVRLVKNLLSAAAIGVAPYIVLKSKFSLMPTLFYQNVEGIAAFILQTGALMVFYALIPMLIISVADLIYTRWDYEENLKMTKDEVKDERKQMEGDPEIKGQQREKMMDVMAQRMLQQVPQADVVITNPTHLAIALAYDALKAPAPLVLAKGAGHMAEKIKEVARENNVPIRENKPLAQALYKAVEVGDIIPEEMYQAVAQILAQLYKYKKPGQQL
jgi:flagellar biosynthetic protein FlhB